MPDRLRRTAFLALATAALAAGAVGCSRGERPTRQDAKIAEESSPPAGPIARSDSDVPAEGLKRLAVAMAAGRGEDVVAALPPRYLADLDRFLAERVRPIDPAARREAANAVAGLARALGKKQDLVLASGRIEMAGPAVDAVRARFEPLCRIVAAAAAWPGWGAPDAGTARSLLGTVATAVAKDGTLAADLNNLQFQTLSHDGDRARVSVARDGAENGRREIEVVRIDERWVPTAFAERWDALFGLSTGSGAEANDLTSFAERANEVSAALREVSSQDDFDAFADRAATLLLATAASAEEQRPRAVRSDEYVTVVVPGPLSEDQKDRVVWDLAAATDAPASGLADAADRPDGGLTINVGPVADLAAFAGRLPGLMVDAIDADRKTVMARPAEP